MAFGIVIYHVLQHIYINIELFRYNPQLDEWQLQGELPQPRFSMGVVSYEGN